MIWSGLHIHIQKLDGSWLVQIGWFNFFVNKLALYIHRCVIEALYVVLSINPNRPSIISGTHVMIESTIMFWQFESFSLAINFVHWLMMKSHCSHWWIGFICWFIDLLIHWLFDSFIHSVIHSLINSFLPSFIHSFTHLFIDSFSSWLIHWFTLMIPEIVTEGGHRCGLHRWEWSAHCRRWRRPDAPGFPAPELGVSLERPGENMA